MSNKSIRLILIMMLLTIGALCITQVYWFNKAFALQERQFDEKIDIALRNVADRLLKLDHDSTSTLPPISKTSSNEFYVNTNCYFSLNILDSLIRDEFFIRNMDLDFDYLILKSENETISNHREIILGNTLVDIIYPYNVSCKERADDKEKIDFEIRINNKTTHLINAMGIWMYSSLTLLLILAVFTFIVVSIVKGKRLALLKKDFVNNMTHELKTPIANISVASDAIRNKNIQMDELKLEKYADIIYNENVRLHHLVDRVLQISSIEKNDESLSFEEIDLHEIIHRVSLSFEPLLQQKNGKINSTLKAVRFKLRADKTHLSNVIYNLIENAIKYSKNAPEISISTTDNRDGINLEISDNGIGISKENQQKIFEKFFRAETGDLHNTKGYGLGLSYVKLIIEKHRGLITFKSEENKGSAFNLFLPI